MRADEVVHPIWPVPNLLELTTARRIRDTGPIRSRHTSTPNGERPFNKALRGAWLPFHVRFGDVEVEARWAINLKALLDDNPVANAETAEVH